MQAIEAEAARRFLKARASNAAEDWDEALAWIAQNPAHGFAFAKAEAGWELTERLLELPAARVEDVARHEPVDTTTGTSVILPLFTRRAWLGMAAAAAVIGVAGTIALRLAGTVDHYRTALGETRTIRLADGSVVRLNTNSSIEVALSDDMRSIKLLKGEARFDVAHDKARPFIVDADGTLVRAVGTMFNVRLRPDLTELTVIEGRVAVRNGGSPVREISGGKSAAVRSGGIAVTQLQPGQVKQRVAWEQGMIVFDGDTLAQAVEEFNRYRATPLVIGDPAIASLRIGGSFQANRSEDFVDALQSGFGVRAVAGSDDSVMLVSDE